MHHAGHQRLGAVARLLVGTWLGNRSIMPYHHMTNLPCGTAYLEPFRPKGMTLCMIPYIVHRQMIPKSKNDAADTGAMTFGLLRHWLDQRNCLININDRCTNHTLRTQSCLTETAGTNLMAKKDLSTDSHEFSSQTISTSLRTVMELTGFSFRWICLPSIGAPAASVRWVLSP